MIKRYIVMIALAAGPVCAQEAGDLHHYRNVARCLASGADITWSRRWVPVRRCGDVSSCEHAFFALLVGGVTSLDRDRDGVPCETVCFAVDDDADLRVSNGCRARYP